MYRTNTDWLENSLVMDAQPRKETPKYYSPDYVADITPGMAGAFTGDLVDYLEELRVDMTVNREVVFTEKERKAHLAKQRELSALQVAEIAKPALDVKRERPKQEPRKERRENLREGTTNVTARDLQALQLKTHGAGLEARSIYIPATRKSKFIPKGQAVCSSCGKKYQGDNRQLLAIQCCHRQEILVLHENNVVVKTQVPMQYSPFYVKEKTGRLLPLPRLQQFIAQAHEVKPTKETITASVLLPMGAGRYFQGNITVHKNEVNVRQGCSYTINTWTDKEIQRIYLCDYRKNRKYYLEGYDCSMNPVWAELRKTR